MKLSFAKPATGQAPLLSFEFFPPKDEKAAEQLLETAEALSEFAPDFVSITYGAGGGTRSRTLEYTKRLSNQFGFRVLPHLTCVGHTREELIEIIHDFKAAGCTQIMALRGDAPKGATEFEQHPGGFRYASDLVRLIREVYPECTIGVGGYPEGHPEAPDLKTDLENLKIKVDAGADFITTQLFYDNADYFRFVEACRAKGIHIPIVPGLMSILSRAQAKRFCKLCGAAIPQALDEALAAAEANGDPVENVGVDWTLAQLKALLKAGIPGVHLYILNRSAPAQRLLNMLRESDEGAAFLKTHPCQS